MNKTKLLLIGMGISLILLAGTSIFMSFEINDLKTEKTELELHYSYAKDMLGGFLQDKDAMKEAVKKIRSSDNQEI